MEIDKKDMHEAYMRAIRSMENGYYTRNLLKVHPLVKCEREENTELFWELKKMGSPACTDGEKIYYSEEVTIDMFKLFNFYEYDKPEDLWRKDSEEYWKIKPGEKEFVHKPHQIDWLVSEIVCILEHEMNHAMFEHLKDEITYKNKSEQFKGKMRVAHEIQANDGFCADTFALRYTQQLKGVTNKRQFPTTIGFHKLKDIIEHLPDDAGQGGRGQGKSDQQKMAEKTGAYERAKQQVEEENNKDPKDKDSGVKPEDRDARDLAEEIGEKVRQEAFKFGKNKLREVIVSAMSDRLKYDAATERVTISKSYKKVKVSTYSRPSKKQIVIL